MVAWSFNFHIMFVKLFSYVKLQYDETICEHKEASNIKPNQSV